jgi:hypothetical protein
MIPLKYVPLRLSKKDQKKQREMLDVSRSAYRHGQYLSRAFLPSYQHRPSSHLEKARDLYRIETITPTEELSRKTGCSLDAMKTIVRKGEGAYFSSGSRPNQTVRSWGLARLASTLTGGNAVAVDFSILEKGCDHTKTAFRLARRSRKKNDSGRHRTRKVST